MCVAYFNGYVGICPFITSSGGGEEYKPNTGSVGLSICPALVLQGYRAKLQIRVNVDEGKEDAFSHSFPRNFYKHFLGELVFTPSPSSLSSL